MVGGGEGDGACSGVVGGGVGDGTIGLLALAIRLLRYYILATLLLHYGYVLTAF